MPEQIPKNTSNFANSIINTFIIGDDGRTILARDLARRDSDIKTVITTMHAAAVDTPGASYGTNLDNKTSNTSYIPVVYGTRRMGAFRTYINSSGPAGQKDTQEYLHIVYTICEGEIEELESVFFNNIEIWRCDRVGNPGGGFNSRGIAIEAGPEFVNYSDLLDIIAFYGTDNQTNCVQLKERFPEEWTTMHVGSGICYLYIRIKNDRVRMTALPNITFLSLIHI